MELFTIEKLFSYTSANDNVGTNRLSVTKYLVTRSFPYTIYLILGRSTVGNTSDFCTSFDCLAAFYHYAVLRDSVDNKSQVLQSNIRSRKTNKSEDDNSKSELSESLETFDVLEGENLKEAEIKICTEETNPTASAASTDDQPNESICRGKGDAAVLSDQHVHVLSQKLLWHSQVKKLELQETLTYIQKAMKIMINKHKVNYSEQNTEHVGDCNVNMQGTENLGSGKMMLTPPSICRTISGEYLHMKPGNATFTRSPSPRQSPRRYFSTEGNQRKRCDSEGHEEMMPCIEENGTDLTTEGSSLDTMTRSGIMQTRIYTKAHNIFSTEMSKSTSSDIEKSPTITNDTVEKIVTFGLPENAGAANSDNEIKTTAFRNQLQKPLDTRYCGEDISVSVLSAEYQRVTAELHDITCMTKVGPINSKTLHAVLLSASFFIMGIRLELSAKHCYCLKMCS